MKREDMVHGMEVTFAVGKRIATGKLNVQERGKIFLCSNESTRDGSTGKTKLGFKYSWDLGKLHQGREEYLTLVKSMKPVGFTENYEIW